MTAAEKLTYSLAEVAEMTGFARSALEDDCRAGRIAHVKRGHFVGMTRDQIEALIAAHTVGATTRPLSDEEAEDAAIDQRLARRMAGRAA